MDLKKEEAIEIASALHCLQPFKTRTLMRNDFSHKNLIDKQIRYKSWV
jgi:hypothetical protein